MKVLFDTSVLAAALLEYHPNHKLAFPWLRNVKKGKYVGFISMHSLAELYAILTTIPIHRKVPTHEIWNLISKSIMLKNRIKIICNSSPVSEISHLC